MVRGLIINKYVDSGETEVDWRRLWEAQHYCPESGKWSESIATARRYPASGLGKSPPRGPTEALRSRDELAQHSPHQRHLVEWEPCSYQTNHHAVWPSAWDQVFCRVLFSFFSSSTNYSSKLSKMVENKECLRNCHGQESLKETRQLNVMWYSDWSPGRGKDY